MISWNNEKWNEELFLWSTATMNILMQLCKMQIMIKMQCRERFLWSRIKLKSQFLLLANIWMFSNKKLQFRYRPNHETIELCTNITFQTSVVFLLQICYKMHEQSKCIMDIYSFLFTLMKQPTNNHTMNDAICKTGRTVPLLFLFYYGHKIVL